MLLDLYMCNDGNHHNQHMVLNHVTHRNICPHNYLKFDLLTAMQSCYARNFVQIGQVVSEVRNFT